MNISISIPWLPSAWDILISWLITFSSKLGIHGTALGLTTSEVGGLQSQIANVIQVRQEMLAKENELKMIRQQSNTLRAGLETAIRNVVNKKLRVSAAYTQAIGEDMDIVSSSVSVNPETYVPDFKATPNSGYVQMDIKRAGMPAFILYGRLQGQLAWTRINTVTSVSYRDTRPLAQANVPEAREYLLFGCMEDEQVGQPSGIVSAVYGG